YLSISDTGKGMNKELIQKIFDPFFTTKKEGKGTGMGLSVVHGIVTNMKGTIVVDSKPKKGTKFNVYLPVEKHLVEDEQIISSKTEIQTGSEHILLVDDEEEILEMEEEMLERLGYQITSLHNSLEALKIFKANPDQFDMVITDMSMPNISGDKLATELIKIHPTIPIIICTGFNDTMTKQKAESLGVKGFLFKPIIMKKLSQKIREVLD
ncbi:MAG: response regulator, partial [Desulfobacteraceae bacterium]|nr:response regulator [Desulfobacteraceae bacterium]